MSNLCSPSPSSYCKERVNERKRSVFLVCHSLNKRKLTANYFEDSDVGEDAIKFQSNLTQQTKSGIFQGCAGSGIVHNHGKIHLIYLSLLRVIWPPDFIVYQYNNIITKK